MERMLQTDGPGPGRHGERGVGGGWRGGSCRIGPGYWPTRRLGLSRGGHLVGGCIRGVCPTSLPRRANETGGVMESRKSVIWDSPERGSVWHRCAGWSRRFSAILGFLFWNPN